MCFLVYKPRGVAFTAAMLNGAAERNSDGWGLAAITKGLNGKEIFVRKGLDWEKDMVTHWVKGQDKSVMKEFKPIELIDSLKKCEMVVHFRSASRGDVSVQNAHPIHTGYGDVWIAHNGGISEFGDSGFKTGVISDTAGFANWIGTLLSTSSSFVPGKSDAEALKRLVDSDDKDCQGIWHRGTGKGTRLVAPSGMLRRSMPTNAFWAGVQKMIGGQNKVAIISPIGITILNRHAGHELDSGMWASNLSYKYNINRGSGGYCEWPVDVNYNKKSSGTDRAKGGGRDNPSTFVGGRGVSRDLPAHYDRPLNPPRICVECHACGCYPCTEKDGPDCAKFRQEKFVEVEHKAICPLNPFHADLCSGLMTYYMRNKDREPLCKACNSKQSVKTGEVRKLSPILLKGGNIH